MANLFDIEPVEMKVDLLKSRGPQVRSSKAQRSIAVNSLLLAESAVIQNDFPLAAALLEIGHTSAKKAKDADLLNLSVSLREQLQTLHAHHRKFEQALTRIERSPDDSQANLTAGRYFCFVLGDWQRGLPLMARCNDPTWQTLAESDLSAPKDANARAQIGDLWWGP